MMKTKLLLIFITFCSILIAQEQGFYKEIILDDKYQLRMNKVMHENNEDFSVYMQLNLNSKSDKPVLCGTKNIFIPKVDKTEDGYKVFCSTKRDKMGFVIYTDQHFNFLKYESIESTDYVAQVLNLKNYKNQKWFFQRNKKVDILQDKYNQFQTKMRSIHNDFSENNGFMYTYNSGFWERRISSIGGDKKLHKINPSDNIKSFQNLNTFNIIDRSNLSFEEYAKAKDNPETFSSLNAEKNQIPSQNEIQNLKIASPENWRFQFSNFLNSKNNDHIFCGFYPTSGSASDYGHTFYNIYMYSYTSQGGVQSTFSKILTGHNSIVVMFEYNQDKSLFCSSGYRDVIIWKFIDDSKIIRKKLDDCLFVGWLDNSKIVCYKRAPKGIEENRLNKEYFIYDFELDETQELTTNTFGFGKTRFLKERFKSLQNDMYYDDLFVDNKNTQKAWAVYKNYIFNNNIINLERNIFDDGQSGDLEAKYMASVISVRKIIPKKINTTKKEINNKSTNNIAPTIEQKLSKLKSLYEKGLITKEEYDQKRKEILENL